MNDRPDVVRMAFELKAQGMKHAAVRRELIRLGYTAPEGGPLTNEHISRILGPAKKPAKDAPPAQEPAYLPRFTITRYEWNEDERRYVPEPEEVTEDEYNAHHERMRDWQAQSFEKLYDMTQKDFKFEGQNLTVEYRWAAGKEDSLPDLARELLRLNVDVIVTYGNRPPHMIKDIVKTTPIVALSCDPLETMW